jgi:hypothetical protein
MKKPLKKKKKIEGEERRGGKQEKHLPSSHNNHTA